MASHPQPQGRVLDEEVPAVLDFLRTRRNGATVLEITRGLNRSAVVVIPVLDHLMAQGTISRRVVEVEGTGASRSEFALTSMGRRLR